ncbi:MAG: tyrosine-type recombinase/integrase [Actinobacteria bacterium]|nr:tyrosine-type recombinase/integrase [Actinomycetota bacterium]
MRHSPLELPELLQQFFCGYLANQRNASSCTIASYRDTIRLLLQFLACQLNRPVDKLTLADLDAKNLMAFLNHLEKIRKNGARTRNQRLAAIRSFLRYVGRQVPDAMLIVQQALAIPKKQYERRLPDFLTREEVEALLESPPSDRWSGRRDRAMFLAMYNTGARVSEIVAARVADVVWGRPATLHLHGKGRKERVIPLWRKTAAVLRDWVRCNKLGPTSPLFPNVDGETMTRSGVEKRLARAAHKVMAQCRTLREKAVSPHVLRHTAAMHLLQSGVDLTVIALWLGHENPTTTHHYMTADLNMKARALSQVQEPSGVRRTRYRPASKLLSFLENL